VKKNHKYTTIEEFKIDLQKKNVKFLGTISGNKNKIKLQCSCGHEDIKQWANIQLRGWKCKRCYNEKKYEPIFKHIKSKRGTLLDKNVDYKTTNNLTKFSIKCEYGHIFNVSASSIKNGHWCQQCSGKTRGRKLRKYTIEDLHKHAKSKGGKCLSAVYISNKTKYKWECRCGYQWKTSWDSIVYQKSWCKKCSFKFMSQTKIENGKYNIESLKKYAKQKNGQCLSSTYKGTNYKYKWKCFCGWEWEAAWYSILSGRWCKKCGDKRSTDTRRGNFNELKDIINKLHPGGKICEGQIYKNEKISIWCLCKCGNKWKIKPEKIKRGRWCPKCGIEKCASQKRKDFDYYQSIIDNLHPGGKIYEGQKYKNSTTLVWVQCEYGHRWKVRLNDIKKYWCPECGKKISSEKRYLGFDFYQNIIDADHPGGKICDGQKYTGCSTPVWIQCKYKHKWKAILNNIARGTWCPICSRGQFESLSLYIASCFLDAECESNNTKLLGNRQHIDIFCHKYKVAIEANGIQHYQPVKHWGGEQQLKNTQRLDKQKKDIIIKKLIPSGVINHYIIIPCYKVFRYNNIDRNKLFRFMKKEFEKRKLPVKDEINIDVFYRNYSFCSKMLNKMRNKAKELGGECLSSFYFDHNTKYLWKCHCGNAWGQAWTRINSGSWCRHKKTERTKLITERIMNADCNMF